MLDQSTERHCERCGSPIPRVGRYPSWWSKRRFCSPGCRLAASVVPLADRFWAKVRKGDGCWEWTGTVNPHGYGLIWPGPGGHKPLRAHRVSWELHFGPIADGLWVLHHCDNPICVRPDHLFLGTQYDNMRDAASKKRLRTQRRIA